MDVCNSSMKADKNYQFTQTVTINKSCWFCSSSISDPYYRYLWSWIVLNVDRLLYRHCLLDNSYVKRFLNGNDNKKNCLRIIKDILWCIMGSHNNNFWGVNQSKMLTTWKTNKNVKRNVIDDKFAIIQHTDVMMDKSIYNNLDGSIFIFQLFFLVTIIKKYFF